MVNRPKTYYVGHIVTRPVRRALMIMLWIAFFVISPSIILYTAGYRYDFKVHEIKQTGVLSVDVEPRDVVVTLNGIRVDKQVPIRLTNRAPGTYRLMIEKPGWKTWQRDIVIESNNTTYIKNVTLIKDSLPIRTLDSIENVVAIRGSGYSETLLILKKINELYELHAFNPATNADTLIYRTPETSEPTLEVSPYTGLGFSRVHVDSKKDTLYLISLASPENSAISSIDSKAKLTWNPINPTDPLYKQENERVTALSQSRAERFLGTVSGTVWFRDEQGRMWTGEGAAITNPYTGTVYSFPDTIDSITHVNNARIIATHADKTMVAKLNQDEIESIQTINGVDHYYNRITGEWLIWSPWELSSIYPDGGVSLLNRSGEKIDNVTLLDNSGVILLATEKELAAFNPGYYVRHTLASTDAYTFVSAYIAKRTLYFFGSFAGHDGLYSLEY